MIQCEEAAPIKANGGTLSNGCPSLLRQRVWFLIAARSRHAVGRICRFASDESREWQDTSACYLIGVSLAEPGG